MTTTSPSAIPSETTASVASSESNLSNSNSPPRVANQSFSQARKFLEALAASNTPPPVVPLRSRSAVLPSASIQSSTLTSQFSAVATVANASSSPSSTPIITPSNVTAPAVAAKTASASASVTPTTISPASAPTINDTTTITSKTTIANHTNAANVVASIAASTAPVLAATAAVKAAPTTAATSSDVPSGVAVTKAAATLTTATSTTTPGVTSNASVIVTAPTPQPAIATATVPKLAIATTTTATITAKTSSSTSTTFAPGLIPFTAASSTAVTTTSAALTACITAPIASTVSASSASALIGGVRTNAPPATVFKTNTPLLSIPGTTSTRSVSTAATPVTFSTFEASGNPNTCLKTTSSSSLSFSSTSASKDLPAPVSITSSPNDLLASLASSSISSDSDGPWDFDVFQSRLIAFYRKYDPQNMHTVSSQVKKYSFKEEKLFLILKQKYQCADDATASNSEVCIFESRIRELLLWFYAQTAPERVGTVGTVIAKFTDREQELLDTIEKKYGKSKTGVLRELWPKR